MIFYSGGTHYIRRNSTFLWNGTNPGIAGQFYNWCPNGTIIEIVDWFFPNEVGMTAIKQDNVFIISENQNNGTESFLIKNPNHSSPTITNRLNMVGAINANGQYYPAKWKVIVPEVPGNDEQSSIDVGDLFLVPDGHDEVLPPAQPEPPIDWEAYHPLDFNQDGTVNIFDANIAGQQYGEVVGMMVIRYIQEQNPYDINGDGIVDVSDIGLAVQAGAPQHIIQYMTDLVLNPPPSTQEYDSEPPVADDGSAYHPLDGNQDGQINILDAVYWSSRSDLSLIARTIVINMCLRYMEGICPYDVTQDGQVSILDITHCAQNGIPENIIQDIVHNVGAEVPMPVIPEPTPPPVEPGPWIHTMNLWMPEGNYMLLRGTPYYGPVHKHHNNVGSLYMTEYTHKNHSVLLIPAVENPAEALAELPSGNLMPLPESIPENTTPVIPPMDFGNFNMDFSNLDFSNFGFGNNTQTQEDSNQTGGAPSNDNNQQNNNSGGNSGGGGGAY